MIGLAKTQDDWMEYITNVDGEIELVMNNENIESTNGLKNHVEITRLELNQNNLRKIGEISFLINLKER